MQNIVDTCTGSTTILRHTNITLDQLKALPLTGGYQALNLGEVVAVAGDKTVEADNPLP